MSEAMGPCDCDCLDAILDLLTPTDHQYAEEWRARCRNNAAERRARCAKPTPRAARRSSSTLRFLSPMDSASTDSMSSPIPQPPDSPLPRHGSSGLYRISNVKHNTTSFSNPNIHTHKQTRRDGNSRYGIPPRRAKGGSSLVRALKARLHSAPVLRFAHLCTPRRDAGHLSFRKLRRRNTKMANAKYAPRSGAPISPRSLSRDYRSHHRGPRGRHAPVAKTMDPNKAGGHPCRQRRNGPTLQRHQYLVLACPPLPSPAMIRWCTTASSRERLADSPRRKSTPSFSTSNSR